MGNRVLVIYIDIDDDLGVAGVQTPVIGAEEVQKAMEIASKYMATDSDFNSMVVAYNVYRGLVDDGEDAEITFLAGSRAGGVRAQRAFSKKLDDVLNKVRPDEAVVVYDSPEDEKALPIVQSKVKIAGVEKVVVEQHRGVEETYAVLGKYLRKLVDDPHYSRVFVGVPGILLVTVAIMSLLGLLKYVAITVALIVGGAMVIRGLKLDEVVENWWENSAVMTVAGVLAAISFVLMLVNVVLVSEALPKTPQAYAAALDDVLPYGVFGLLLLFFGKLISKVLGRDVRLWHDVMGVLVVIVLYYLSNGILKAISLGQYVISQQLIYGLVASSLGLISLYVGLLLFERRFLTEKRS
ncbi:hypothetical protein HS1genome_1047 [Sulfodiicoccus acidiphilus]|uniref:DUF373 domain-containing protein n=1 Tax=Sulfodiicoccus acidiphilus TaxID=1670455 RepID=A0A348B3A6_9CREN|nr:DUF373 family protein [Sulfodiicoccus acidiphilus]BBD72658.1 hypothetical protein HS1genome_1047 [Sulfodiicoccus acidiphilus]GGT95651.1 hypothetical protein GCM10007116_11580 [Sulfodiicoccus acidiphilus]